MRVEIMITAGPAKGQHFTFDKPDRFLFGRTLDARVSLPNDPYVSRQHFLLEISPPSCKVTDLGSKNGTFVNGVRYGGRKPPVSGIKVAPEGVRETHLQDGDKITVGDTQMKVSIESAPQKNIREMLGATVSYIPSTPPEQEADDPIGVLGKLLHDAAEKHQKSTPEPEPKPERRPATPPRTHPKLPDIPGYHIEEMLDRGGMGMVYKGIALKSKRAVAVKVMLPHMAADPDNVYAFQREIDLTRQLQHTNIVQLYDHGKTETLFYFVLEYVNGMNLHQFLEYRKRPLALDEAAAIMLETLDGLSYAHQAKISMSIAQQEAQTYIGVVHRDLKPQNILLGHTGKVWVAKISDFGISKSFESAGLTNITKPGEVLGTPMYWPREQITHYKYLNPATDVFSVAAVFYELLTGKWVREGFKELFSRCKQQKRMPAISDYMSIIIGNPAIPIRDRNPKIPEPVARVLDRALQEAEVPYDETKMREALAKLRYPDARAFREVLVQAFEEAGLTQERILEAQRRLGAQDKEQLFEQDVPDEKEPASQRKDTASSPPQEGSIFYSIMRPSTSSKQVALLVLYMEESSDYLRSVGETYFSNTISLIHKRIKNHPTASDLMFMKSTGDGFLVVFKNIPSAFDLALSFLKTPVRPDLLVRSALHWGEVKIAEDGDALGVEVHRIFRVVGVQMEHQVDSEFDGAPIPASERIVITKRALDYLPSEDKDKFRYVGQYHLKGFEDSKEALWALHKK